MLQKKKHLGTLQDLKHVKIFEDLTLSRLQFFKFMKADERINQVWTREGTIFFKWNNKTRVQSVKVLYEGGFLLGYSVVVVESFFPSN